MKLLYTFLGFGLFVLSFICCEKDNDSPDVKKINQRIIFQYDYINFAWGYQHNGWFIDSSGNVSCYNLPDNWHFPYSLGYISAAAMDSNLMETDSICYVLDKKELAEKVGLIEEAAKGELSEPMHTGCDMGGRSYTGFIYNSENKTYKEILLKQTGDWSIDNYSQAAVDLSKWLESINCEVNNICY